jgi:hypothetical protein
MTNITIKNNKIKGRTKVPVRVRLFTIDQNGDKQATSDVIDIQPGKEERVNLASHGIGFELRVMTPGSSYGGDEAVAEDIFGKLDAFERMKKAIRAVPAIRADMTLSEQDRDAKAGAAWSEALRLAQG